MNPKWKVKPTIDFIDSTMKVLTCKYHDGKDARMPIHAFCWNHHLPSDQPDQILQVVTQSRNFGKGKASLYFID